MHRNSNYYFYYCIDYNQWEILFWLAQKHKNVLLETTIDGFTIIHELVKLDKWRELDILDDLLRHHTSWWMNLLNLGDSNNLTPLMVSVSYGKYKSVRVLLNTGKIKIHAQLSSNARCLDKTLKTGFTSLHIAAATTEYKMVELLLEYGATEIWDREIHLSKPRDIIGTLEPHEYTLDRVYADQKTLEMKIKSLLMKGFSSGGTHMTRIKPSFYKMSLILPKNQNINLKQRTVETSASTSSPESIVDLTNLENAIFNPNLPVERVQRRQNIEEEIKFDIEHVHPAFDSLVIGGLFIELKKQFINLKNVDLVVINEELFKGLAIIIRSLLVESKLTAIRTIWIVKAVGKQPGRVKRNGSTLLIRTRGYQDIENSLGLQGSLEICMACPIYAIYTLAVTLGSNNEIKKLRNWLKKELSNPTLFDTEYLLF